MAQAVEITLSDGRVGVFLGRALVTEADANRATVSAWCRRKVWVLSFRRVES